MRDANKRFQLTQQACALTRARRKNLNAHPMSPIATPIPVTTGMRDPSLPSSGAAADSLHHIHGALGARGCVKMQLRSFLGSDFAMTIAQEFESEAQARTRATPYFKPRSRNSKTHYGN